MAKSRSPNYPAIGLDEALEAIGKAFAADHRNKMSRETLAKHMGYTSLNGRALGKLGALRAYGLIDGSGDELRVSDDAVTILNAPQGSSDREDALARCARRPKLFDELLAEFPGRVSDDTLRYELIKRHFTPDAAGKVIKSYRATIDLVSWDGRDCDVDNDGADEPLDDGGDSGGSPRGRNLRKVQPGMKEDVYTLKEGDVVFQWPDQLSQESYEDLKDWTDLILRKIKRHVVATNGSDNGNRSES